MEKPRKSLMIALLILSLLAGPTIFAELSRIWSRDYLDNIVTFEYVLPPEFTAFVMNTFGDYCHEIDNPVLLTESTTEYTVIPGYSMTMITIQSETYTDPWAIPLYMDFDFIIRDEAGDPAEGAVLQVTGKYVTLYIDGGFGHIEVTNPSFDISLDVPFLLDMTQMEWLDCRTTGTGEALLLTFHVNTNGIEESESREYTYSWDVTVGIGT